MKICFSAEGFTSQQCPSNRHEAPTFYAAEWMPPPGTAAVFVPGPAMVPQAAEMCYCFFFGGRIVCVCVHHVYVKIHCMKKCITHDEYQRKYIWFT